MKSAALVLAGVWMGALLASWVAATVNFRTVDRVLGPGLRSELDERLRTVPPEERRQALRHLASEINRWTFRYWSLAQLALGAALVALCWAGGGPARMLAAAAVALVLLRLALTGSIVEIGRAIDFVARPLPPATARRFGLLHTAFVVSDLVKLVLLVAVAWLGCGGDNQPP